MLTVKQVLQTMQDGALRQAVLESEVWNRSGLLQGDALRRVANRLKEDAGIEEDGLLRYASTLVYREAAMRFIELVRLVENQKLTHIDVEVVHNDQSKTTERVNIEEFAELMKRKNNDDLREINIKNPIRGALASNAAVTVPPATMKNDGEQDEFSVLTNRPFREHLDELQSRHNWSDAELGRQIGLSSRQYLSKIKTAGKPMPLPVILQTWQLLGYPFSAETVMALTLVKY